MTSKATLAAAPAAARAALRLGTEHFREANEKVRTAFAETDALALEDVHAQRYLGCAMPEGKRLEIHGTPGNDLACYMDGGSIEVFGNAQDQVGNTMNGGEVVIHGRCGDAGSFLGEYQAGGIIVLMGHAGAYLATGMHGGVIYLAHPLAQQDVRAGLVQEPVDADDLAVLAPLLDEYARLFDGERALPSIPPEAFSRLRPESSRPYGSAYVG